MLAVGSMVYCGLDGVCTVVGTVEKKIDGQIVRYYELHPYYRKNDVIFLPAHREDVLARLRPLTAREDIPAILQDTKDARYTWLEPEPLRRDHFKNILRGGDPRQMLVLVQTLYDRRLELMNCGKKLRTSDNAFLKDAEKLLHEEFAYVLGISPADVPAFIESHR